MFEINNLKHKSKKLHKSSRTHILSSDTFQTQFLLKMHVRSN